MDMLDWLKTVEAQIATAERAVRNADCDDAEDREHFAEQAWASLGASLINLRKVIRAMEAE